MLGQVLLSRGIAYDAWSFWADWENPEGLPADGFYIMSKLSSLRITGPRRLMLDLEHDFEVGGYVNMIPGFAWSWEKRAEQPSA